MDNVVINITDTPNEVSANIIEAPVVVTVNVSNTQGPPGPTGPSGIPITSISVIENINAFDVVNSDGSQADSSLVGNRNKAVGIALNSIANGFSGDVQMADTIINPSWTFVKGDIIYLNGTSLSTIAPSVGFSQIIGKALSNNTIEINIHQAVML